MVDRTNIEAEIKFEREGLHGIVAIGSYLSEAAKRFGVKAVEKCDLRSKEHRCEVEIQSGADLLSPRTKAEKKYFEGQKDADNMRLACQVKIEKAGEVEIMTKEAKAEENVENGAKEKGGESDYLKSFAELPLDKKMGELVKLEAMALGDTLAYIANAPYTIAEKAMDILAGFGFRKHEDEKAANRPEEHAKPSGSETKTESTDESDKSASV